MDRRAWWVIVHGVLKRVRHDLVTNIYISSLLFSKQRPPFQNGWDSDPLFYSSNLELVMGRHGWPLRSLLILFWPWAFLVSGEEERFRENSKSLFPGWVCHFFLWWLLLLSSHRLATKPSKWKTLSNTGPPQIWCTKSFKGLTGVSLQHSLLMCNSSPFPVSFIFLSWWRLPHPSSW